MFPCFITFAISQIVLIKLMVMKHPREKQKIIMHGKDKQYLQSVATLLQGVRGALKSDTLI